MGGLSAEREVSLSSGRKCAAALAECGHDVSCIDAGLDLAARLNEARPDVAFNALHGRYGEDGCVQGMLEWMRVPYTHSGVFASALAMDKHRAKQAFRAADIQVAESIIATKEAVSAAHVMPPPYVVKPRNEGSSVGVVRVLEADVPPPRLGSDAPDEVMVEKFVPGRELTVAVLGDRALEVTDIISAGWYDYHAKYTPGASSHVIPADVPADVAIACRCFAEAAHAAIGCRGVSRCDFRWNPRLGADGVVLLEINSQPGMTPTSLVPEQAQANGMSFADLCAWLVEDASCDR